MQTNIFCNNYITTYCSGLESGSQTTYKHQSITNSAVEVLPTSQSMAEPQQGPQAGHWGENRLADVVKGKNYVKFKYSIDRNLASM